MPETTLQLLRHILNAQAIWLSRIKNIATSPTPFDAPTLDQDRHLYENTSEHLQALAALTPSELATHFIYNNTKGEEFINSINNILTLVLNHSTYHCAQIARDLRQHNLEPINTDYIFYIQGK